VSVRARSADASPRANGHSGPFADVEQAFACSTAQEQIAELAEEPGSRRRLLRESAPCAAAALSSSRTQRDNREHCCACLRYALMGGRRPPACAAAVSGDLCSPAVSAMICQGHTRPKA
jgi:hypothetical protein